VTPPGLARTNKRGLRLEASSLVAGFQAWPSHTSIWDGLRAAGAGTHLPRELVARTAPLGGAGPKRDCNAAAASSRPPQPLQSVHPWVAPSSSFRWRQEWWWRVGQQLIALC
jgi:hypothetical protein